MRHKVLVLSQDEFALGFKLAGVKAHPVKGPEEAKLKLQDQLDSKEYGIILIDEGLIEGLEAKFKKRLFDSERPLIMPIPLKREFKERPAVDEFEEFVRAAIGFKIRVR